MAKKLLHAIPGAHASPAAAHRVDRADDRDRLHDHPRTATPLDRQSAEAAHRSHPCIAGALMLPASLPAGFAPPSTCSAANRSPPSTRPATTNVGVTAGVDRPRGAIVPQWRAKLLKQVRPAARCVNLFRYRPRRQEASQPAAVTASAACRCAPHRRTISDVVAGAAACQRGAAAYPIGNLLGNHDRGRIEVAGDDSRHDRGIHHA